MREYILCGLFIVLTLLCSTDGFAAERYAGINVPEYYMTRGTEGFYSIYGYWPNSWSEVVESGIVQAPLVNVDGQIVDPDDGKCDFVNDLQYISASDATAPSISTVLEASGRRASISTELSPATPLQGLVTQALPNVSF